MTEFKVGMWVSHKEFGDAEVTYVPSRGRRDWVVIHPVDGTEFIAGVFDLTLVKPDESNRSLDPRIDVVAKALAEAADDDEWQSYRLDAHTAIEALDSMDSPAGSEPAVVWDSEGDRWNKVDDGSYRWTDCDGRVEFVSSYEALREVYGPLLTVPPQKDGETS